MFFKYLYNIHWGSFYIYVSRPSICDSAEEGKKERETGKDKKKKRGIREKGKGKKGFFRKGKRKG